MSLMSEIRSKQIEARKSKDVGAAAIFTTLLGEAGMIGKNNGNRETTDSEVIAVVRKFIKNNEETMLHIKNVNPSGYQGLQQENALLESLLPTQLTEVELRSIITALREEMNAGPKDMGKIMAKLKADHDGTYDGRLASTLVKEILQ